MLCLTTDGLATTSTSHVSNLSLAVAVMMLLPISNAVTKPSSETDTNEGLELLQVTSASSLVAA